MDKDKRRIFERVVNEIVDDLFSDFRGIPIENLMLARLNSRREPEPIGGGYCKQAVRDLILRHLDAL